MAAFVTCYRLLPRQLSFCTPSARHCRSYALSRFPHRTTGFGRSSRGDTPRKSQPDPSSKDGLWTSSGSEKGPFVDHSQLWNQNVRATADPGTGLKRLLMSNDELVVTRQVEMLNIFMGFEQANRYAITNPDGESLGYIVEEPRGFFSMFARQVFRTHRPFRALVMDLEGSPLLWIRRPFSWINSRMFVQRPRGHLVCDREGELVLDTFAEVQQEWHLWRRRYDLFLRSTAHRVLTPIGSDPQPEPSAHEAQFSQFARVDEGLWAWDFVLRDAQGGGIASVNRAFRGFGREIFTDTGRYNISFRAPDERLYSSSRNDGQILHRPVVAKNLTVDERALVLATASEAATYTMWNLRILTATSVNIDYDYFSRHSEGGHGFTFWWNSEV